MHTDEHTPTTAWWKTRRGALVALNAGLLMTLGGVLFGPEAIAQAGAVAGGRAPGEYTLVGGDMPGTTDNTIFVLDAANRELIALEWSQSRSRLEGIGFRDLADDVKGRTSR